MGWTDYAKHAIPGYTAYKAGKTAYNWLTAEPESAEEKRRQMEAQGASASNFADIGEQGYGRMTAESQQARDYLRRLSTGQDSVSAEQLRQANQQTLAAQRSMAAGAAPQNAVMAARTAANNMNRASIGMAGQQAVAGLQERQAAQQALANMIMQQRQQDMGVALGSRGNAIQGYGGITPEQSNLDKIMPIVNSASGFAAGAAKFSDKRLKEDIEDGDTSANDAMKSLRAYTYKYKDKKLGAKSELGIMAQDLEKAGLKHAVMETPRGKAVHGAALATANTAMLSALERRVAKMEKGRK